MEYRSFDKLGIKASLLGYGCMRFPLKEDGKIDEQEAERLLDTAYKNGVTYYDTAYAYHDGQSEIVVGNIMKKYPRDSFYLATKLPVWLVSSPEDIDRIFDEQLKKLQTDYIDFYLIHALNKDKWHDMLKVDCVNKLLKYKEEGRIKYLGFSFHDGYEAFEEIVNYMDWDFAQIQFNYMDSGTQASFKGYELAKSKGIPLVIMEPVKGGTLAKLPNDAMELFMGNGKDASAASYALRWVGSLDNVKVILSGMTTMEQLQDNLKTFDKFIPLSSQEMATIDRVKDILLSKTKNGCTGCRYCMPCPQGVDIPGSFSCWNQFHMYENYDIVKWQWETQIGDAHQPKNCIECGSCEAICPQHLPIIEQLKKAQGDVEEAGK